MVTAFFFFSSDLFSQSQLDGACLLQTPSLSVMSTDINPREQSRRAFRRQSRLASVDRPAHASAHMTIAGRRHTLAFSWEGDHVTMQSDGDLPHPSVLHFTG